MKYYLLLIIPLLLAQFSCVSTMPGSRTFNYCYPNEYSHSDSTYIPYAIIPDAILSDTLLTNPYSIPTLHVANATGILPDLSELVQLKNKYALSPSMETELKIISKKQEIANRLIVCRTEIAGIAAELDCEGERADQLSAYMAKKESKQINKLTVASITLGALTAVAAIIIKPQKTSDAVAITGGLGSAALGLLSLSSSKKTEYLHPRNLLTDIWYEPVKSGYYPTTIWYLLNHKEFSNNKQHTICHNIQTRWKEYNQLGDTDSKKTKQQIALLFGSGGTYTSDLLETRANMLNQLQAAIKLLDQEIQQLLYTINK